MRNHISVHEQICALADASLRQPPSASVSLRQPQQKSPSATNRARPSLTSSPTYTFSTGTQLEIHAYNKGGHNGKKNTSVQLDIVIR